MPIKAVKGQAQFVLGFILFLCLSAMALSIDIVLPLLAVDTEGLGRILFIIASIVFAINSVISLLRFLYSRTLASITHFECDTYLEVDGHRIPYEDVSHFDVTVFDSEYVGYRRYRSVEAYVHIIYTDRKEEFEKQCGVIIQDISFLSLLRLRKKCKSSTLYIENQWLYPVLLPVVSFLLPILLSFSQNSL